MSSENVTTALTYVPGPFCTSENESTGNLERKIGKLEIS